MTLVFLVSVSFTRVTYSVFDSLFSGSSFVILFMMLMRFTCPFIRKLLREETYPFLSLYKRQLFCSATLQLFSALDMDNWFKSFPIIVTLLCWDGRIG